MKLLIVVGDMNVKSGGVTRLLLNLIENSSISNLNFDITLAYTYSDIIPNFTFNNKINTLGFRRIGPQKFGFSIQFNKFIKKNINNFSLIHFHGVWDHCILFTSKLAISHKIPYVISTHGMLENWSLSQSFLSKKLWMFANNVPYIFSNANAFIFSTNQEKIETLTFFKYIKKYYIVANGLNLADFNFNRNTSRQLLSQNFNKINKSSFVFVFSSRIHNKKNPLNLLKAFHNLLPNRRDLYLLFLGIEDDRELSGNLKTFISNYKLDDHVFITFDIVGRRAQEILAGCDFFVLPSYQEGFSMAVIESMACGVPVVISKFCNFDEVEKCLAGVICDTDISSIEKALNYCINLNQKSYQSMCTNSRRLISENYTQEHIMNKFIAIYKEVLKND